MTSDFLRKMQKLCQCGHSRMMHYHGFTIIAPGEEPQSSRKDVECRADKCDCQAYDPVEKDK